MFIEPKDRDKTALPRSAMFREDRHANMPLVRSLKVHLVLESYKYFVPPGLASLTIIGIICALFVINSRAHVTFDPTTAEPPQEQMQFPEGLDYGKFQHSSRNHSRLPCLLCH